MKGVVFTEFLEMVEERFGLNMVDHIIEQSDLPSGGAYTAVGTYDHDELLRLIGSLSEGLDTPVPDLVHAFAHHLFNSFVSAYPFVLAGMNSSVELLENIEGFIHVEVRKLYPDAELPSIDFRKLDADRWELTYHSTRPFADLCQGLIDACSKHFADDLRLEREDLEVVDGFSSRFVLSGISGAVACTNTTS